MREIEELPPEIQEKFDKAWGVENWDGGKIHPVDIWEFLLEVVIMMEKGKPHA